METFSDRNGIKGGVESKIGGRSENQDSYGMSETPLGMLVVVCDGMGGGPAGKTASTIATQAILDYVSGSPVDKDPASVLEDAGVAANEAVMAAVAENPTLKGMGTTCVCVLVVKREAFIMHIGDSRCYQLRGGAAIFRTADHSYVGELVRRGTMSEEDARNSRYSNVITRAIGAGTDVVPEVDRVSYKPGDRFALMSDGIWGSMPEPQLVVLLCSDEEPAELVVDVAERVDAIGNNHGGGHDNLTLAVVDIPGSKVKSEGKTLNDKFSKSASSSNPGHVTNRNVRNQSNSNLNLTVKPGKQEDPEPDSVKQSEEKTGNAKSHGHGVTTWLLGGLLIIAIGVISWLLCARDSEDEKTKSSSEIVDNRSSSSNDVSDVDDNSVETGKGQGMLSDNSSGKSTPKSKDSKEQSDSESGKTIDSKTVRDISNGIKQQDSGVSDSKNQQANKDISDALVELDKLINFNQDRKSKDKKKVRDGRSAIFSNIVKKVRKAYDTSGQDERFKDVLTYLETPKVAGRIVSVDKNECLSTADAVEEYEVCKKKLESLITK